MKTRKLFCEYGPACYWLSCRKESLRRDLADLAGGARFCTAFDLQSLPVIVKGHRSMLLRPLQGVDPQMQHNKIHNLRLASARVDGVLIHPGETFSFWRLIGRVTARRGYLPGLTISTGRLGDDVGGGLCQLANLIHWLVLHSPLQITELHHHSDALFPDAGRRVPFGTGTSVFYKHVDYRFYNGTGQTVQLRIWLDESDLCGELRTRTPFPHKYRIEEQDHHYAREGDDCYRNSVILRHTVDRATNRVVDSAVILRNHSRVMYDHSLIPPEEIRT